MSEIKLKPCPFCGCKNIQFWETDNDTHRFQIVCMQCFNGTDECISEEVAIEKWNTRNPMANIVENIVTSLESEKTVFLGTRTEQTDTILIDDAINIVKQEINNGLE